MPGQGLSSPPPFTPRAGSIPSASAAEEETPRISKIRSQRKIFKSAPPRTTTSIQGHHSSAILLPNQIALGGNMAFVCYDLLVQLDIRSLVCATIFLMRERQFTNFTNDVATGWLALLWQ